MAHNQQGSTAVDHRERRGEGRKSVGAKQEIIWRGVSEQGGKGLKFDIFSDGEPTENAHAPDLLGWLKKQEKRKKVDELAEKEGRH